MLLERAKNGGRVDAQVGDLGVVEFDKYLLFLLAKQFHFCHVGHAQQFLLDLVGVVTHFGVSEAVGGERVDIAVGVAKLVVKARADHACRKRLANVADFFSHLVLHVRQELGVQLVFDRHKHG